jgi:hypothetical protein
MNGGPEGGRKPLDLRAILEKADAEARELESILPRKKERAINSSELEEAMQYAVLSREGRPLQPEGGVIHDSAGGFSLTLPNPDIIQALHVIDNRINSFDFNRLKLNEQGTLSVGGSNIDSNYNKNISAPLAAQVLEDFPSETMLLARGIAASINGPVYDGGALLVRDIRQILRLGDEKGDEGTLMGSIGLDSENMPAMHHRVNQYLIAGQANLRQRFPAESAKVIFPVLLVYDKNKVKALGGYDYTLPNNAAERSACILKAYILPRPEY